VIGQRTIRAAPPEEVATSQLRRMNLSYSYNHDPRAVFSGMRSRSRSRDLGGRQSSFVKWGWKQGGSRGLEVGAGSRDWKLVLARG
jgi:hypothetical protein